MKGGGDLANRLIKIEFKVRFRAHLSRFWFTPLLPVSRQCLLTEPKVFHKRTKVYISQWAQDVSTTYFLRRGHVLVRKTYLIRRKDVFKIKIIQWIQNTSKIRRNNVLCHISLTRINYVCKTYFSPPLLWQYL